jgi:hypothetical protein
MTLQPNLSLKNVFLRIDKGICTVIAVFSCFCGISFIDHENGQRYWAEYLL